MTTSAPHLSSPRSTTLTCYLAFFTNGMLSVITANLMNYLQQNFQYSYPQISLCLSIQSFGNLIMVALSGWLIQHFHKKYALWLFPLLFLAGCLSLLSGTSYPLTLIGMLLTGIGWGLCNNIIHLVIKEQPNCSTSISILHTAYAVGSFIAPLLMTALLLFTDDGWRISLFILIGFSVLLLILYLLQGAAPHTTVTHTDTAAAAEATIPEQDSVSLSFLHQSRFYLCFALYFCYVGLECALNTWLVNFLSGTGRLSFSAAQLLLSLFWITMIFSRLANTWTSRRIAVCHLLLLQGIGSFFFTLLLILSTSSILSVTATIGIGVFMGGISPCNALNAGDYITGSGISSGILFAGGGLGSMLLPLVAGSVTQHTSIYGSMYTLLTMMVLFILINGINTWKQRIKTQ